MLERSGGPVHNGVMKLLRGQSAIAAFGSLLVVASSLLLLGAPGAADESFHSDPDDSASALDISRVRQGHYFSEVLYRVSAHEHWDPVDLAGGRIEFFFDTDADEQIERRVVVEYREGGGSQLRSTVFNGRGERIGRITHRRPTGRSVEIWIKRWQLNHSKRFDVFVTVMTRDDSKCLEGCVDRFPDEGTLVHRLKRLCSGQEPTIQGSPHGDEIRGTKRIDVIATYGGADEVKRLTQSDVVCAGPGDDSITGGSGFLFLKGGSGDDKITATGPEPKPCDDVRRGASCAFPEAYLNGGSGADLLIGGKFHESFRGGRGRDVIYGRSRGDGLDGGRGYDRLFGGPGEDGCVRGEVEHSC